MITDLEQTAFVTGGSGFVGGRLIQRLVADGWSVRALARSKAAAEKVEALGAESVRGDLDNGAALRAGAHGCQYAFHAAAHLGTDGDLATFEHVNVQGTKNVLAAMRDAGVKRLVHVGTEAALLAGEPLLEADERTPLRPDSPVAYSSTKAKAEIEVLGASEHDVFETVCVRPRFVWGVGDTTLLPNIVEQVRSGQWAWIAGGRNRTSTTHVDNAVQGLVLGALRGTPGNAYFVLDDGGPVVFREFLSELMRTQGVEPPSRSVPAVLARAMVAIGRLPRFAYWVASQDCILDDTKARTGLGYAAVKDRATGLAEMSGTLRDVVATGV
jgi:nucleoside-diphosphate-sugar epimerase